MKAWVTLAAVVLLSIAPSAQQALDRKKIPPPSKTPELRVPAWTKSTLANGAELIVAEKHDLPLISFSITFLGGADQFEPAGKQAVASLTAALLSEGTQDARRRGAVERTAAARHDGERFGGQRERLDQLPLDGREVPGDAGHPRGHTGEPDVSCRRPRAAPRPASGAADTGPRPARRHRQPCVPAHRLRLRASVRARRHRRIAEGDHARRSRRVPQGLLPAGPCAGDRGRRHDRGVGETGHREGAGGMGQGRREARVHLPDRRRTEGDDDLPGRQAWRSAVDVRDRPSGSAAEYAGLLRAPGDEHDPRRHVPVAPQRQHPRREGLQLRRQLELRLRQGPRRRSAPAATSSPRRAMRHWSSS